ncbi:MAG: hypothetical protein WA814_10535 [Candidatus Baltobacteraceae bacterium]
MIIGIVGSDDRAIAIGRLLRRGGHSLSFSDPTARERADRAAAMLGSKLESPYRQAMRSDLLLFTVPREQLDRAVAAVGSGAHAVIVDAIGGGRKPSSVSGAELVARKLDSHRVVRALINMPQPGANIPICGDDALSKRLVDRALHSCGCITTDRGPLAKAPELEPPG